jgi:hypothetical protein
MIAVIPLYEVENPRCPLQNERFATAFCRIRS